MESPARGGVFPRFETVGASSGLDFRRFDDISGRRRITEVNGGGVGVIDFDHDGLEDLFLPNGCRLPMSPDDDSVAGALFRNCGNLEFKNVSSDSGLRQLGFGHGCAVADWDGDGFSDLYVTAFGEDQFWRNNGDGTLTEVASQMNISVPNGAPVPHLEI